MRSNVFYVLLIVIEVVSGFLTFNTPNTAIDQELHEAVLDPDLCHQQIRHLRRTPLQGLTFADAGLRIPRGILTGGTVDLGNYHQCLDLNVPTEEFDIHGKYCLISIPIEQTFHLPWSADNIAQQNFNLESLILDEETKKLIYDYYKVKTGIDIVSGLSVRESVIPDVLSPSDIDFVFGLCIPKPCSTQQAMTSFLFNLSAVGFHFEEEFCRLPDDKPFVAADYVVVFIFIAIGILTVLSTGYDLYHKLIKKQDSETANKLCQSFSVYTNGRRLLTFSSDPNRLQCLDGIRTLALLLVIGLHTFLTENFFANPLDALMLLVSWKVLWLTSASLAVDTFLTIAGIIVVYTTAGHLSGLKLFKKLHIFYLKRLLRMFPLLALTILFQASIFNRMFDGPYWTVVATETHACREFWWATLLHIQNYFTPYNMCLSHSWYLAIEVQLYIISPLVLCWVLGNSKMTAWFTLTGSTLAVITGCAAYCITQNFPSGVFVLTRVDEMSHFMINYYYNTLTRGSPFFVGMMFGYLLYVWKGKKPKINLIIVISLWICTFAIYGLVIYSVYQSKQLEWDNQVVDNLVNSFSSPGWALAVGWMIFACVHGYSGPINWFLTLSVWKLPSRLSYAMFLLHYPLQYVINATVLAPTYVSILALAMKFASYYALTLLVSFAATIIIELPLTVWFKLIIGDGLRKQKADKNLVKEDQVLTTAVINGGNEWTSNTFKEE